MAALGRIRRVLTAGMISLVFAAASYGASGAGGADLDLAPRPLSAALSDDAISKRGDVASDRDPNAERGVSLQPTAADLEALIERTLGAADLQALVEEAASGAVLDTDPRVRELGAELDLRPEALARTFAMLGRQDVPPERLANVLAEIIARHQSLLERVRLLEASDPRAAELRDAVAAALETADYEHVDTLLAEAEAIEFEALQQLLAALDQRIVNAAAINPEAGAFAGAMLGHKGRAGFGGLRQFFSGGRFCQWHLGHRLCERLADSSPLCERRPNHPLCDDDRFCKKGRDHPLCDDDPPPSPS